MKKRADGRFSRSLMHQGRRIYVYGHTKEELDEKWLALKREQAARMQIGKNITLAMWMLEWYNVHKRGRGAIKTQLMYANIINTHINPALGHMAVKEIRNIQLQKFLNDIDGSKSLVTKVRLTLQQVFRSAMVNGYIMIDPSVDLRVDAPEKPKRQFLTPEQRLLALEILKGHRAYHMVLLFMYTGMREGELLALTKNDIKLDEMYVNVNKAVEFHGVKPVLKEPKTEKGTRKIPFPADIVPELDAYLRTVNAIYAFPKSPRGGMHTQTSIDNLWRRMNAFIKRWFKEHPEMKEHEFTLTFRTLRHTYATGLYDADIDPKMTQEIMGHANLNTTQSIYTHIQEHRKASAVTKIQGLYQVNKTDEQSTRITKLVK